MRLNVIRFGPRVFRQSEPASMSSRYPSPAELDAFAQKSAYSPLSIKIFPTDVRVPQHKQLNKTVNGLDTTDQRFYSHPYSGGYQGLLATVKASAAVKGLAKNPDGRRTKHANTPISVAPYNNPLSHGYAAYHIRSCKLPDVPIERLCPSTGMASGAQSQPPRSELAEVQSLMRQTSRVPHSQALQLGGEARTSPSLQAVAAVAHSDSDFVLGVPPQSSLAFTGATVPKQSAEIARGGYLEKGDGAAWRQKHRVQQQPYQQGAVRMHDVSHREAEPPETCPPLRRPTRPPCRLHPTRGGAGQEQARGSSLSHVAIQGEFPVGQHFAPLWGGPDSDSYTSQVLATSDVGISHPHLHPSGRRHHRPQRHPHRTQAYSTGRNLCRGLSGSSLGHAAALSSSLRSLECLVSEIHPPCIKERMLGRGYEATRVPQLLEHHQQTRVQLPVHR
ncbi:protein FAM222A-like [Brachionichthys hirsutus]|uniref:protein FAM222A-like n=1 Tax=Brachionichthys hirsutus TaxID=412623 RepID=UPI0036044E7C